MADSDILYFANSPLAQTLQENIEDSGSQSSNGGQMYENTSEGDENYQINEELENLDNLEMKDIVQPKKKKKKLDNIIEDPECIVKKEEDTSAGRKTDQQFTFSLPPAVS